MNGKFGRWAVWNACVFTTICEEWESVEVRSRTTQYTWTHVMNCDNNPSQNPGASSHRFPSNWGRRARWLSVFGMNESQLRVAAVSSFQAPSRWQCQKRTNGSLRSAPCMSVAQKLQLLLSKYNNPAIYIYIFFLILFYFLHFLMKNCVKPKRIHK